VLGGLREQGVTFALTTHYMEEAARLCDRLVIMDAGRIVDEGTPADLTARQHQPDLEVFLLVPPRDAQTARGLSDCLGG
jgi:ABC-type multidrug transport system ATPase subunit